MNNYRIEIISPYAKPKVFDKNLINTKTKQRHASSGGADSAESGPEEEQEDDVGKRDQPLYADGAQW
jgi:hypothetical protein